MTATEITDTNNIPPSAMDLILDALNDLQERLIRTETRVCHLLTAQGMDVMGHKLPANNATSNPRYGDYGRQGSAPDQVYYRK